MSEDAVPRRLDVRDEAIVTDILDDTDDAHSDGIVNLSPCQRHFANENEYEWLPRLPIPS